MRVSEARDGSLSGALTDAQQRMLWTASTMGDGAFDADSAAYASAMQRGALPPEAYGHSAAVDAHSSSVTTAHSNAAFHA